MAKKKRTATLLLLALVLLLLGGATLLVQQLNPETEDSDDENSVNSVEILSLDEDSCQRIQWSINGEDFSFEQGDDGWYSTADSAFPVEQSRLAAIFSDFNSLLAYNSIASVRDLSEYGLDEPQTTVTFRSDEGETTLRFGDASPMDSLRYVLLNEDTTVYLVSSSLLSDFNLSMDDFLAMEELPSMSKPQQISVSFADMVVELNCVTNTVDGEKVSTWYCGDSELDATAVQSYFEILSQLNWERCVNYKANEDDLAGYGFSPAALTASVFYFDEDEQVQQQLVLEIGDYADEEQSSRYARLGLSSSPMVYTISSSVYEQLSSISLEELLPQAVTDSGNTAN